MIIGRLCISFDRGTCRNRQDDIKAEAYKGQVTEDGKVIRGLGSHFRSVEAKERTKELSAKEQGIRNTFKRRFVAAPIPGCVILPEKGAGKALMETLEVPEGMSVFVSEYELVVSGEAMPPQEVVDWANRIKAQLAVAPLGRGRGKFVKDSNLELLDGIADCPIISAKTRDGLRELIAGARLRVIEKGDMRRKLEDIVVEIDVQATMPRVFEKAVELADMPVEGQGPERGDDGPVEPVNRVKELWSV